MKIETKIEDKVMKTLSEIGIKKKDKILVALSGGKDSSTVAYLLSKLGYSIEGIYINLGMGGYSKRCFSAVDMLCKKLEIKLHVYDIKREMGSSMCYLRSVVQMRQNLKNCAICGVIKKWILNKEARKLKADKIATGHNLDDEAQTFVMNLCKGSLELSFNSGLITKNILDKKFIPRIKPLFYVAEEDIRKYSQQKKLPVVYEKCPCAIDSYRIQVRNFFNTLDKETKLRIVMNFEKFLRNKKSSKKLMACEICGEPSRNNICKKCRLINTL